VADPEGVPVNASKDLGFRVREASTSPGPAEAKCEAANCPRVSAGFSESQRMRYTTVGVTLDPIGVIHSPYKTKQECPIQGAFCPDAKGTVEVFRDYEPALRDIESFSHLYLLYHFDRAGDIVLIRPPFLDDEPHGVFASRHPCRPNGLGLSIVGLLKRERNLLTVSGIDVLDQTPLVDIKPYIPSFDSHPQATEGWVEGKKERRKPPGRE
jgi:tRNA-Thr(GGU) m(6)t(6)A37 methyltransferase TsaA